MGADFFSAPTLSQLSSSSYGFTFTSPRKKTEIFFFTVVILRPAVGREVKQEEDSTLQFIYIVYHHQHTHIVQYNEVVLQLVLQFYSKYIPTHKSNENT